MVFIARGTGFWVGSVKMATTTDERILDVKELRTYFYTQEGEVKAVDGLSYHINKGESVGLVGESACGKSVSALSILRLIPYPPGIIVGGEIFFQGQDLLKASEADMRHIRGNRIAMIFQEPTTSLNPVLTVKRQISEALELHRGMDKEASLGETIRLLKLVGIPDAEQRAQDYPFQFSGGMQQRIMIAMALSCDPALLIADEPTTSVDVTVQAQLLEILAELRDRLGTAVLIITHNLGVVARYVDRVQVMYAGRLVETAPTDELYSNPKHPYTIGLLASVPRLDSERKKSLRIITGLPPNLARLPGGCAFHPRCEYAMDRCRVEAPTLEKIGEDHLRACFYDADKLHKY
ncbi:MAG TPA: ABC transporter ATP-binding protein [Dehalococcoidales bacterium]|nr:ABC transporter ATP-binding protein [Dehalococcoidales bacterium]